MSMHIHIYVNLWMECISLAVCMGKLYSARAFARAIARTTYECHESHQAPAHAACACTNSRLCWEPVRFMRREVWCIRERLWSGLMDYNLCSMLRSIQ